MKVPMKVPTGYVAATRATLLKDPGGSGPRALHDEDINPLALTATAAYLAVMRDLCVPTQLAFPVSRIHATRFPTIPECRTIRTIYDHTLWYLEAER